MDLLLNLLLLLLRRGLLELLALRWRLLTACWQLLLTGQWKLLLLSGQWKLLLSGQWELLLSGQWELLAWRWQLLARQWRLLAGGVGLWGGRRYWSGYAVGRGLGRQWRGLQGLSGYTTPSLPSR